MIEFQINTSEGKALFLDHQQIINKSYSKYEDGIKYKLKPQLFAFRSKPQEIEQISSKKRKRKLENMNISPEVTKLKQTSAVLISNLKEVIHNFEQVDSDCPPISRVWEEPISFPQLHGANERSDFQIFTFQNRNYLIPPHCKFFNHDLLNLTEISSSLERYDFIVIDPAWRNKYIRRIKKIKPELGYKMLDNNVLSDIDLGSLIHCNSVVVLWCTNSIKNQQMMLEEFFPRWDLKLVHKIIWLKLNTDGNLIGDINNEGNKQPYEVLFVACHCESTRDFSDVRKLEFIMSVPSVIHSHKPPIIDLFRNVLPTNPKSLELFARYLQPGFTSIGLEVLKLMDHRLYTENK